MPHRFTRRTIVLAAVAVAGASDPVGAAQIASGETAAQARANVTDRAFVRTMIPHHQMANEMAEMAEMDGEHRKIRTLAARIIRTQGREIRTMRRIARNLGVTPSTMSHHGMSRRMMRDLEVLGVSEEESAMTMDMAELEGADPFDRTFIDMMIPHHQGAIRMARAELAKGIHRPLRRLARTVVTDQSAEIRKLNRWRKAWYGATSPAGGVPRD